MTNQQQEPFNIKSIIRGRNVKSDILKKSGINYRELRIRRYFSSEEPLLKEEHPYHHRATKGSLGNSSTDNNNDSKSNGDGAIEDSFLLGGYQWWIELVEDGDVPSNRRSHSATTFRTTTAPSIATNNEDVDLKGPAKNATKINSNGNNRERTLADNDNNDDFITMGGSARKTQPQPEEMTIDISSLPEDVVPEVVSSEQEHVDAEKVLQDEKAIFQMRNESNVNAVEIATNKNNSLLHWEDVEDISLMSSNSSNSSLTINHSINSSPAPPFSPPASNITNNTSNAFSQQQSQKPLNDHIVDSSEPSSKKKKNHNNSNMNNNYMVISGGFTDTEWTSFPVYIYNISSTLHSSKGNQGGGEWYHMGTQSICPLTTWSLSNNKADNSKSSKSNSCITATATNDNIDDINNNTIDSSSPQALWPPARVGHLTVVSAHTQELIVFGGMIWQNREFQTEAQPYIYRTLLPITDDHIQRNRIPRDAADDEHDLADGGINTESHLIWKRMVPKVIGVDKQPPAKQRQRNLDAYGDVLEEILGNDLPDDEEEEEESPPPSVSINTQLLSRGETTGGLWTFIAKDNDNNKDNSNNAIEERMIIYGGIHVTTTADASAQNLFGSAPLNHHSEFDASSPQSKTGIDIPLGDIWSYNLQTNEMECLVPYPPPSHQRAPDGSYPLARTAHSATVIGNALMIYGGMTIYASEKGIDDTNDHNTIFDSGYYSQWRMLDDVWMFDLVERTWGFERVMQPKLARSYHSLVGYEGRINEEDGVNGVDSVHTGMVDAGSVVACGGFRTTNTIGGEEIAFVFSDALVAHPNDDTWYKVQYPYPSSSLGSSSRYYTSTGDDDGMTHRLEHTAVMDQATGSMLVWGGRFRTVSEIGGVWFLNVLGEHANVVLAKSEPDGLDFYEAQLRTLHMLVLVMMFIIVMVTALYGTLWRRQERRHADGGNTNRDGNGRGSLNLLRRRNGGVGQDIIDTLPVKKYHVNSKAGTPLNIVDDATVSTTSSEVAKVTLHGVGDVDSSALSTGAAADGCCAEDHDNKDNATSSDPVAISSDYNFEEEEPCCPICLVEYGEGDEIRTLPCDHYFHKDCVDSWLSSHVSCPACRALVIPEEEPIEPSTRGRGPSSSTINLYAARAPIFAPGGPYGGSARNNIISAGNTNSSQRRGIMGMLGSIHDSRRAFINRYDDDYSRDDNEPNSLELYATPSQNGAQEAHTTAGSAALASHSSPIPIAAAAATANHAVPSATRARNNRRANRLLNSLGGGTISIGNRNRRGRRSRRSSNSAHTSNSAESSSSTPPTSSSRLRISPRGGMHRSRDSDGADVELVTLNTSLTDIPNLT